MTMRIQFLSGVALLALTLAVRAGETTADLIKQARQVSRSGSAEQTRAAYEPVLAAADLTVEQRVAVHLDVGRVLMKGRGPRIREALEEYDKALSLSEIPDSERFEVLTAKAEALYRGNFIDRRGSYHTRGIDAALEIYREVAASDKAAVAKRIAAFDRVADCLLDKLEEAEALAAVKAALELPGLSDADRETAEFNVGRCLRRQGRHAEAQEIFDRLLAVTQDQGLKRRLVEQYTAIFVDSGELDAAETFLREQGRSELERAAFNSRHGRRDRAVAIYIEVLDDAEQDASLRWRAFQALVDGSDYGRMREWGHKYLDGFLAADPKKVTHLLRFFSGSHMGPYYAGRDSRNNPAFLVWAAEKLLAYTDLSVKDRVNVSRHLINAHLDLNNRSQAVQVARQVAACEECDEETRARYSIVADIVERKTPPAAVGQSAKAFLEQRRNDGMGDLEQAEALGELAKVAVRACNDAAARAIDAVRGVLIKHEPPRSLNCEFVDEAPRDISAWLASPAIREQGRHGVLDRAYGNNLKDLIATDASTTDRVTGESGAGDRHARFSVLCDAAGMHFFFLAPCKSHEAVAAGFESAASYEIYLAPGENEPYYCFIVNPAQNQLSDGFHTMYRNRFHRRCEMEDKTLFTDSRATPQGVATYLRIPWEVLYDKLPRRGDAYEFDCIYWADGGRSWGGSKSVHNRSSFGKLVFSDLSAGDLLAVKRRLLKQAYERYGREKAGHYNGVLDFWEDPELGDPRFYDACLRELVRELDEYGSRIDSDMTDEEVAVSFAEAVPRWMEIEYVVAELRKRYMRDRFFGP